MLGRDAELAVLRSVLDEVDRHGAAIALHGEVGIGKTTLVEEVRRTAAAAGFRVLTCSGVQSETRVGLAGLHQLLHVVVDRVDALPEQQRAALRSAFGIGADATPDRLLLSVAVLGLLEEVAQDRPLLLVLEDVQWMDEPTVHMIGFVARRLAETRIVLLATCRTGERDPLEPFGMRQIALSRLPEDVAGELVDGLNPALSREARTRVLAEAEGNPLALVELTRGIEHRGLTDATVLPDRLPLGARLEHLFAGQVGALPPAAGELLLLAAANTESSLAELALAGARLGLGLEQLGPAEDAGLVRSVDRRLEFRHPLIRSAVYGAAPVARRVAAHRALAEALADDPVRAAWHRAAATVGRDETVAADLETAAGRDRARGGVGPAVRSLERAADLSPDPAQRARRLSLAAAAARQAGLTSAVDRLVDAAARLVDDPAVHAELALTRDTMALHANLPLRGVLEAVAIGRAAAGIDLDAGATLLIMTSIRCETEGVPAATRAHVERAVLALGLPVTDLRMVMALTALDPAAYADRVLPVLRATTAHLGALPPPAAMGLSNVAELVHEWEFAELGWASAADASQRAGAVADHAMSLCRLALTRLVSGRLAEALADADQAGRLARDLDLPTVAGHTAAIGARVHAWRGEFARAASLLEQCRSLVAVPLAEITAARHWAAGLTALGEGRHRDGLRELEALAVHPETALLAVGDLVEAACRAKDTTRVAPLLDEAEARARAFDSPLVWMLVHRAHGLVAEQPEQHFKRALADPGTAAHPLEVARTRLVLGEWLRRQRRIGEAREELAAAARAFDVAGARPWAERARTELRATGLAVPRRAESPLAQLTSQELQIARLAAKGFTNKEIADQLFLSHRTVSSHLYRIFPKLGINSRAELRFL
ncbi:helix-turn-helix transcriptional regulator [Dactylosporangium sp. CS-033363]|uniref:helix-turn-helix transcriptional regulator n=1 Tax=Dactylosporangium sp. CS-033363 TaxID=3239935 RepID=UPI003D8DB67B